MENELPKFLDNYVIIPRDMVIVREVIFLFDVVNDRYAQHFISVLDVFMITHWTVS